MIDQLPSKKFKQIFHAIAGLDGHHLFGLELLYLGYGSRWAELIFLINSAWKPSDEIFGKIETMLTTLKSITTLNPLFT